MDVWDRKRCRDDFSNLWQAAYDSKGLARWALFFRLAVTSAWFGLIPWHGVFKAMWFGCLKHQSINFE